MVSTGKQVANRRKELQQQWYKPLSRVQDVFLSAGALILLFPLMVILALLILIDSPGASPFFTQTRVGLNGKHFTLYKFRTMRPGAEQELSGLLCRNEMTGPVFKMQHDPRVTRVGRLLRRTRLDELPQFWNVLKGDMRIVGPRPALPHEVAQYSSFDRQRLTVMPGMTCYWQIQPRCDRMNFHRWMVLDRKYISEQSFVTDWKIIAATLTALLRMDGM